MSEPETVELEDLTGAHIQHAFVYLPKGTYTVIEKRAHCWIVQPTGYAGTAACMAAPSTQVQFEITDPVERAARLAEVQREIAARSEIVPTSVAAGLRNGGLGDVGIPSRDEVAAYIDVLELLADDELARVAVRGRPTAGLAGVAARDQQLLATAEQARRVHRPCGQKSDGYAGETRLIHISTGATTTRGIQGEESEEQ